MDTAVKLLTRDAMQCAVALMDPCVILVECGKALGLLISKCAEHSGRKLLLRRVTYLRVLGPSYRFRDFDSVAIRPYKQLWTAQELETRRFFPEPSSIPYRVLFLTQNEYWSIRREKSLNHARPIFELCQARIGALSGFGYAGNLLWTPDGYAQAGDGFPGEYVVPRGSSV
jgi:hypothetical protein